MHPLLDDWLDRSLVGYTRLGPRWRGLTRPSEPRLDGKVAVVSGATSGIGLAAAAGLAALGAEVVMLGRDRERAARARSRVMAASGSTSVWVELADLSSARSTAALAQRLALRGPIHLLVNNSGVMLDEREHTDEGVERTLATNLLSHFVLTEGLLETLAASAPARIVNVSSGGMYTERLDLDALFDHSDSYDGVRRYAQTKRAQVELTAHWAESWLHRGIQVHAMHPGWVDTPGVERSLPRFHRWLRPWLRTPEEGADTIVWLCSTDDDLPTGCFWHDRRPRPAHRLHKTQQAEGARKALWWSLSKLADGLLAGDRDAPAGAA